MALICPICHAQNADTATECSQCGRPFLRPSSVQERQPRARGGTNRERLYTVLGGVMMVVLLVAGSFQVKRYLANFEMKHSAPPPVAVTESEVKPAPPVPAMRASTSPEAQPGAFATQLMQQKKRQEELEQQNRMLDEQRRQAQDEVTRAAQEHKRQLEEEQKRADEAQRRASEAQFAYNLEQQKRLEEERRRQAAERDSHPAYNGPMSGALIWTGIARKGEEITIEGNRAETGTVSGSLPGVMVGVDLAPESKGKAQIVFAPSRTNNYRLVSFRVLKGSGATTVRILWNRP